MKKNYFKRIAWATLVAGLVFTSCSDNLPDGGEDKGKTEGEMGYISLALINSSVRGVTKAEGDTHYGTADENKVNSAIIVLYDGDDPNSKVKYQILLDQIGTPIAPGGDMHSISPGANATTYRTKAKEVVKANYKLAVFINPPADLTTATAVDAVLSIMTTAATVTVDDITGAANRNNFLMSNFAGLIDVKESDIYDTADKAEAAPVKLNVERAVAKVTMNAAADITTNTTLDANIGEIKWDVDVVNKKTFWMRNPIGMLDESSISSGSVTDTIPEVATAANRIYMYAKDPNWDDVSHSRNASSTFTLSNEFNYKSGTAVLSYEPTTNTTYPDPVNKDTYAYVTENTMDAKDQWEDVTTCVLISAVITPKTTFFKKNLTAGDPYFLYRNMAFTLVDIQEIYAAAGEPTTKITNANNAEWKDLIQLSENAGIIALPTILVNMATDFSNYTSAPTASKDITNNGATVRFFAKDAPNYYYVPIRHFSNDLQDQNMAYGRYGVVRNNWYNLSLNSIKNYGTAEIPEPKDRPDPDDKDESWLSVEFTILPWLERNQGIDL
ncbi:hypothetical protein M2459_003256 [Parabacteroides sp. PF5-5]|uniref:Mfa1 family fimbria major subunit n=1 Tax=unclassified Parabacteroides TaxID=2649774 RepID=UPI0024740133|nr:MULTISPECIES: Mfa1 family fimbria major subunit [unclassified Parabacteroides]MDH6306488.1 hypothetical protein [Parabacteroides sp. PH5-39]MDH6317455.1 hypothetical protein [Parabacteroides sp. PF5-13]MDH6321242.1 hypothetical protein [Parabacteroides sp. PH5-13]MDH6324974.1 hypothetical protein [Parabacteroides sp. PH5-8]MDH6328683.1 hypothetical protein [Parabacteroides sp. PH5-41]